MKKKSVKLFTAFVQYNIGRFYRKCMEVLSEKEELMKAYWLGRLRGERLESVETEWFGNDANAQLLEIARMDLIDEYIGGELENRDKILFEQNFLANNLDDVVLGKFFNEVSRQPKMTTEKSGIFERFFDGLRSFGNVPRFAAVAVLLLIFFGFFTVLLVNNYKSESQQIARQTPPDENSGNHSFENPAVKPAQNSPANDAAKTAENTSAESILPAEKTEKTANQLNRNLEPAKNVNKSERNQVVKNQVVFLTILRGDLQSFNIANSAETITLTLDMPGLEKAYDKYEARILDSGGNEVFRRLIRENLALKKSGESVTVSSIKTDKFKNGEKYKTVLVGIDKNGAEKNLGSYVNFERK